MSTITFIIIFAVILCIALMIMPASMAPNRLTSATIDLVPSSASHMTFIGEPDTTPDLSADTYEQPADYWPIQDVQQVDVAQSDGSPLRSAMKKTGTPRKSNRISWAKRARMRQYDRNTGRMAQRSIELTV